MGESRKKEKVKYKVVFVPDKGTETDGQFSVKFGVVIAFLLAVILLAAASLGYCIILSGELDAANNNARTLKEQVDALTAEKEELATEAEQLVSENEELQEKVEILSDTVNDKVQQETRAAQSHIPTGFPLRGSASYNEQETELDGNPIAIFQAPIGTSVIATANGTVSSTAGSADTGYIVMIDHGNGYFSVYRNGAEPKVKEGDEVTKATELFSIDAGHEELGYQIIQDNIYIDPLGLMELYG